MILVHFEKQKNHIHSDIDMVTYQTIVSELTDNLTHFELENDD